MRDRSADDPRIRVGGSVRIDAAARDNGSRILS
jgi:hypothetical protein